MNAIFEIPYNTLVISLANPNLHQLLLQRMYMFDHGVIVHLDWSIGDIVSRLKKTSLVFKKLSNFLKCLIILPDYLVPLWFRKLVPIVDAPRRLVLSTYINRAELWRFVQLLALKKLGVGSNDRLKRRFPKSNENFYKKRINKQIYNFTCSKCSQRCFIRRFSVRRR